MDRANQTADKLFRYKVKKRDKNKCKKCGSRKRLNVHHIKTWAECPEGRRDMDNAITLCRACHDSMKGNERLFERMCKMLIAPPKVLGEIYRMLNEMKESEVKDDEENGDKNV